MSLRIDFTEVQNLWERPFQLLEYQWRWREGKFDTLGKLGSAHLAVGQHPYKGCFPYWQVGELLKAPAPLTHLSVGIWSPIDR